MFVRVYYMGRMFLIWLFLVPDYVEDETAGCIHFADQFSNRYGVAHPDFFPGSLEDAIKESCLRPAKDVRHFVIITNPKIDTI